MQDRANAYIVGLNSFWWMNLVGAFIAVNGEGDFYFVNVLAIWFFLSMVEWVKVPFDTNDVRYIEEIQND